MTKDAQSAGSGDDGPERRGVRSVWPTRWAALEWVESYGGCNGWPLSGLAHLPLLVCTTTTRPVFVMGLNTVCYDYAMMRLPGSRVTAVVSGEV